MESHAFYMKRCIELASKGGGLVHPNPLVGALLVSDGNIIGEGFHERFGGPHAEVNAIRSVSDPSLLSSATLYVTLEPCCHYGKTPPCADLIIASGIRNVVIGNTDPNPLMNGKGIERLTKAGIKVTTDILGDECGFMNRRFITFQEQKRPYVVLKWAVSSNGVMGDSSVTLKVSNDVSRRLVHKWRTEEHGILIGKETALLDDPLLDARLWGKPDPVRIIIDPSLALPDHLNIFRSGNRVIILNTVKEGKIGHIEYMRFSKGAGSVQSMLSALYKSNIVSVLVEGGRKTLDHFLDSNIWDECRVFRSTSFLDGNIQAPAVTLAPHHTENINGDILTFYYNPIVSYVQ